MLLILIYRLNPQWRWRRALRTETIHIFSMLLCRKRRSCISSTTLMTKTEKDNNISEEQETIVRRTISKNKLINTISELIINYHWWWQKYIAINSRPSRLWPREDEDDEALRTSNLDVWHQLAQEGQTFSSSSSRFCRVWKIFSHQFLKLCIYKVKMISMFWYQGLCVQDRWCLQSEPGLSR